MPKSNNDINTNNISTRILAINVSIYMYNLAVTRSLYAFSTVAVQLRIILHSVMKVKFEFSLKRQKNMIVCADIRYNKNFENFA